MSTQSASLLTAMRGAAMLACAGACLLAGPVAARDRYGNYPAVRVSPALENEWLLQLSPGSGVIPGYHRPSFEVPAVGQSGMILEGPVNGQLHRGEVIRTFDGRTIVHQPGSRRSSIASDAQIQTASTATPARASSRKEMIDPQYLPQVVDYQTTEAPGTVVIDTEHKFLYHVEEGGKAKRYGVGVGKPGFEWAGTHTVSQKREWPTWTPPSEMREREKAKGRILPVNMDGGPENPLGARAMYLGSTLYRIHGTNQPWTIGKAVSSGCIRMRNEDVMDLYEHVDVGTHVIVM